MSKKITIYQNEIAYWLRRAYDLGLNNGNKWDFQKLCKEAVGEIDE